MRPEDFDFIAKLLKDRSGLVLTRDKAYLLESRLMPVTRKRGLKGLDDLIQGIRGRDEGVIREVTEAMATNESFFFRDIKPFDQFRDMVLPYMLQNRAGQKGPAHLVGGRFQRTGTVFARHAAEGAGGQAGGVEDRNR